MKLLYILLFILYYVNCSHSYTIRYNDCHDPANLETYAAETFCNHGKSRLDVGGQAEAYTILQRTRTYETKGYSCEVRKSVWYLTCGVWSHTKLLGIPKIYHPETITVEMCRDMVRTRMFMPGRQAEPVHLNMNQPTYVDIFDSGYISADGNGVHCTGVPGKLPNGKVIQDLVIADEYMITLREETYLVHSYEIEVARNHVVLTCESGEQGCREAFATFIWNVPLKKCTFEKTKQISAVPVMETYILDEKNQLLLNLSRKTGLVGCDLELDAEVYLTEYPEILVLKGQPGKDIPMVSAPDVNTELNQALSLSYQTFRLEREMNRGIGRVQQSYCRDHNLFTDQPLRISGDKFMLSNSEVVYVFTCPIKETKIRETDVCFDAIPVEPSGFVTFNERVFQKDANPRMCNHRFPPVVQTQQGYVELIPLPKPRATPRKSFFDDNMADGIVNHTHVKTNVLYTKQEIENWLDLISFPTYSRAMVNTLTLGQCINDGQCQPGKAEITGLSTYSFDSLLTKMNEELNPWEKFRNWIKENGDIMALIVIVYVILKFLINSTMLIFTLVTEGFAAMLSLFVHLYFSTKTSYDTVKHRVNKEKMKRKKQQEDLESTPVNSQVQHSLDNTLGRFYERQALARRTAEIIELQSNSSNPDYSVVTPRLT